MRGLGSGGVAAALLVGLGAAVATAGGADDVASPGGAGLLSNLLHEKPKSLANIEPQAGTDPARPGRSPESLADQLQRHKNAWFRRMEVCDRLQMIADQTGNEALRNQANELAERANVLYRLQTSRLPLPAQAPLPVLAADRENPNRDGKAAQAAVPAARPNDRGSNNSRRAAIDSPAGLGGGMDQGEQGILNGTSMGEK